MSAEAVEDEACVVPMLREIWRGMCAMDERHIPAFSDSLTLKPHVYEHPEFRRDLRVLERYMKTLSYNEETHELKYEAVFGGRFAQSRKVCNLSITAFRGQYAVSVIENGEDPQETLHVYVKPPGEPDADAKTNAHGASITTAEKAAAKIADLVRRATRAHHDINLVGPALTTTSIAFDRLLRECKDAPPLPTSVTDVETQSKMLGRCISDTSRVLLEKMVSIDTDRDNAASLARKVGVLATLFTSLAQPLK